MEVESWCGLILTLNMALLRVYKFGWDKFSVSLFKSNIRSIRIFMQSCTTDVIQPYMKTSHWFVLQRMFIIRSFLSVFLFRFILYPIPCLIFWSWLYSIIMFLQRLYCIRETSNHQQLLLGQCTSYVAVAVCFCTKPLKGDQLNTL